MPYDLTIPLDPDTQSGLGNVTVKLYAPGSLAKTIPLVESPTGSAIYTNTSPITGLAAQSYVGAFYSGTELVGTLENSFNWNGTAEVAFPPSAPVNQELVTAGPTPVTIGPASIASSVGGVYQSLSVFQSSQAVVAYYVVTNNAPLDMTGHAFKFTVHDVSGNIISTINNTVQSSQFQLSASVNGSQVKDVIQVTLLPANLSVPGTFLYKMWDTTTNMPLATGQLGIILAV